MAVLTKIFNVLYGVTRPQWVKALDIFLTRENFKVTGMPVTLPLETNTSFQYAPNIFLLHSLWPIDAPWLVHIMACRVMMPSNCLNQWSTKNNVTQTNNETQEPNSGTGIQQGCFLSLLLCHGHVKNAQELVEWGLVHAVHHAHLTDQEVHDAATGGHYNNSTYGHTSLTHWPLGDFNLILGR